MRNDGPNNKQEFRHQAVKNLVYIFKLLPSLDISHKLSLRQCHRKTQKPLQKRIAQ